MNIKGVAVVVVVAGVIGLSGCGSSTSSSASGEVTTSASVPPADGGNYSTVVALKDAYVAAGGECPEFNQTNVITLAAESADWSEDVVLSTYLSANDISQVIQNVKGINVSVNMTAKDS